MSNNKSDNWEDLRASYRPDTIRVVFVGESPPASGRFFYCKNSILYHATKEAFNDPSKFLTRFRNQGFYLDDLVPFPINCMEIAARDAKRLSHEYQLAARLKRYQPLAVVTVMKSIKCHVDSAIEIAGLSVE